MIIKVMRHATNQKFREIVYDMDVDGYPCTLNYWMWEKTNICTDLKVSFHYGCKSDAFKYTEEIAKEVVCALEGKQIDFQSQIVIE